MLHVFNIKIKSDKKMKGVPHVISTHSKMAPIPMLMFSAVMYLVYAPVQEKGRGWKELRLTSLTRPIMAATERAVACQNVRNTDYLSMIDL